MSRLGQGLSRVFGRVEILARGAEPLLKRAEAALERGDALEARSQARALLARVPESPVGLALWADAAEECGFFDEVVEALAALAEHAPWRQELWLRLGEAGLRSGWSGARDALERAATKSDAPDVTRRALLALADLDIEGGEPARASRWLERVPFHPSLPDPALALRRAECAFELGRWDEAEPWLERALSLADDELGGRLRLLRARAAARWPDRAVGSDPVSLALGAFMLGTPGADRLLVQLVAESRDAALVARAREAVSSLGDPEEPRYKAAFALAEGRRDDARAALVEAARGGDRDAALSLAIHAVTWRDMVAVSAVAALSTALLPPDVALLWQADTARRSGQHELALERIEQAWQLDGAARRWAEDEMRQMIATWLPREGAPSAWPRVFDELHRAATRLDRRDLSPAIEALVVERERPLYVAILGEFNAGKSTLINALLATDVAPTGVRPTTASLHWVAWAPDPFARVLVRGGPDRVVSHDDLKGTLEALRRAGEVVERVLIYAPVERLKRIEILDTPGFNAPDTNHAIEARRGIEEAHVALWLLDATAPLKESERQVISEVAGAGVPMQVLVNKRDRLSDDELRRVMEYVATALETTGIVSLHPPVAMSAQLALRGRLGDEDALAASGWLEVEAVLAEHVVNVADTLRERALRRKAARIAAELAATAAEQRRAARAHGDELRARAQATSRVIASLRSEQGALVAHIMAGLEPTLAELSKDMIPIAEVAEENRGDPEVRSYVIKRTVERLTPAVLLRLADGLRERGEALPGDTTELGGALSLVLTGAAAAFGGRPPLHGLALSAALTVAVSACADALARDLAARTDGRLELARSLRVRALEEALSGAGPRPSSPPEADSATAAMAQNVATPTSK